MSSDFANSLCAICGNISALMCQRCGEPYCNEVCQRKDWQRHKYFCIIMPPLIALNPIRSVSTVEKHEAGVNTAPKSLAAASSKGSLESIINESDVLAEEKKSIKLSTAWRDHVNPPENDFFDCVVTCLEEDGSFWVTPVTNTGRLERLTNNMARLMQGKKPCGFEEISIGDLVGAAINLKIYRAEVMALDAGGKLIDVRLIDFGSCTTVNVQDVYLAVPRMAEIKAFAFRVKLSTKANVELNKRLSLCLLGSNNKGGIYPVQQKISKTIPLCLPVQMLSCNPKVNLVKSFTMNASLEEPQVALLQLPAANSLNDELNSILSNISGSKFSPPFPEKLRSFYLAARTKHGYRRALLIDFIEQPTKFLVYEMDEGKISITNEICRIPTELIGHPLSVFAVTLADGDKQTLFKSLSGRELSIKFREESLPDKSNEKLRTATANLVAKNKDNNVDICVVKVDHFMGQIAELGLKYWMETIEDGSMVYISHIENYCTISISSVETKIYEDIFQCLESKCLPFSPNSDIPIGCVVLVIDPNRRYYRAEVINSLQKDQYNVRNIDTDAVYRVSASYLRKSCAFLENLPVSRRRASIKNICSIPSNVVPPNATAHRLLKNLYEKKTELQVQFTDSECSTLDLHDAKVEPSSLVARMLPMMFTPSAVKLKPAQSLPAAPVTVPEIIKTPKVDSLTIVGLPPLPPSPPATPIVDSKSSKQLNKRHYFEDVKREMLPLGDNVKVLVLNAIDLHKTGYITACYFPNEKVAENFQNLLNLVGDIGSDNNIKTGYLPDIGEMCLTLFTEDNSWYRGVCLKVRGNDVEVLYCDFGNSEIVPRERIKHMPNKLLQTVYATKSLIYGFDKSKDFMALEEYLSSENNIVCTVLEGLEPNTRMVKIPTLDKILSNELNS